MNQEVPEHGETPEKNIGQIHDICRYNPVASVISGKVVKRMEEDLRGIQNALNQVQDLSSVASRDQVKSVMNVFGKCALHIGDKMVQLAQDIDTAKKILGNRIQELKDMLATTNSEMAKASKSAETQTAGLVRWTKVMAVATAVYAALTLVLIFITIFKK